MVRQFFFFLVFLFQIQLSAQERDNSAPLPIFPPFEGTVYEMPVITQNYGNLKKVGIQEFYTDTVYTYPVIGDITLKKLNIPETYVSKGSFPGVDRKTKFAMILHSKMKVQLDACYEFALTSDDGSRLWLNEIQVVNNDGGHGMKTKKDTVALREGLYDAKVWYFQSFPDRFGLELDTKIVGKVESCSDKELGSKQPFKKIVFENVYFDIDKYTLKEEGISEIEKVVKIINESIVKTIKIVGHTDNQGTEDYNKLLSLNRSDTVASSLQERLTNKEIEFVILGRGQSEPVASNNSKEGRSKNRRVEIFLIN